jgi:hypothetical protein
MENSEDILLMALVTSFSKFDNGLAMTFNAFTAN